MTLQRPVLGVLTAACTVVAIGCHGPAAPIAAPTSAPMSTNGAGSAAAPIALDALLQQQAELRAELAQLRADIGVLLARGAPATATSAPAPASAPPPDEAPATAEPSSEDAVTLTPPPAREPAQEWVVVAQKLIEDEDCATAIRVLNVAADVDPTSADVRFHRGVARHLLQSYQDALTDFEAAVALTTRPDLALICRYNQACSLARLGRTEEAIDQLRACDDGGFRNLLEQMNVDPDLDSLRDVARFRDFVMELRTR